VGAIPFEILRTPAAMRARAEDLRRDGRRIAVVPTMGALHDGHLSLLREARGRADIVIVTIFVNPTQFGPNEDLAAYPRDPGGDDALAAAAGVDVMFRPGVEEMYPDGPPRTTVHVSGLTEGMCGATRPTHFDGVTTVVAKLFSIVGPCHAYFGRKDFQQLAVVRRMTSDLDLPVTVVGRPLIREADGLALSSRNAYLTADERAAAPALFDALAAAVDAVRAGARHAEVLREIVQQRVAAESQLALEYVEVRAANSLDPVTDLDGEFVVALAARAGRARLIDNVVIRVAPDGVDVDLGERVADGPSRRATP
jgi:pantoate--beta-alanine ligase